MKTRIIMLSTLGTLALVGSMHSPAQASPQSDQTSTPGTVNPLPATSPVEGTAADRTPPGATAVRGTDAAQAPSRATHRMAAAGPGATRVRRASTLIGMPVQSPQGQELGQVKDILITAKGQVVDLVLAANGNQNGTGTRQAVPWSAVSSMEDGSHHLVVNQSQLQSLPSGK